MKANEGPPVGAGLGGLLSWADETILPRELSERAGPVDLASQRRLHVGADLGTAYLVLVVLDASNRPLAWRSAPSGRRTCGAERKRAWSIASVAN